MTEWSRITPPSPVREIEQARRRALELREQVAKRIEKRDQAAARVVELERKDREQMAQAMAAGEATVVPDVEAVEKARAAASGELRAAEALQLAIQTAEDQLHELVIKHRAKWAERAARDVVETRTGAQAALSELRTAVGCFRDAQQVEGWLRSDAGLDREQRAKTGLLGHATGSEQVTGNGQPVDIGAALGWIEQSLEEPRPKAPEPQPLQQIAR